MVYFEEKGGEWPYFDLVLGGSDVVMILVLQHVAYLSCVHHLLLYEYAVGQLPNVQVSGDSSAHQIVIVRGDHQRGHGFGHADPELCLLRVVGPDAEEGLVELLA